MDESVKFDQFLLLLAYAAGVVEAHVACTAQCFSQFRINAYQLRLDVNILVNSSLHVLAKLRDVDNFIPECIHVL